MKLFSPRYSPLKLMLPVLSIVIVLTAIAISTFGWWVLSETHDPVMAKDYNWLGRHACPDRHRIELQHELQKAPGRPDENELWNNHIRNTLLQHELDAKTVSPDFFTNFERDSRIHLESIMKLESHYRVEVRRTTLEVEARRPVKVFPICSLNGDYELINKSGLTYHYDCATDYPEVNAAHDRGRTDTLLWYLKHGIFPVNYHPVRQ